MLHFRYFRGLFLYGLVFFGNFKLPHFVLLAAEFHYLDKEIIELLAYLVATHYDLPRVFLPLFLPLNKHVTNPYFFHNELYSRPELDRLLGRW